MIEHADCRLPDSTQAHSVPGAIAHQNAIKPEFGSKSSTLLASSHASMPGVTAMRRPSLAPGTGNTAITLACWALKVPVSPCGGPAPKSMSLYPLSLHQQQGSVGEPDAV